MGLFLHCLSGASHFSLHGSHDRLSAVIDSYVGHRELLLSACAVSLQRFQLTRNAAREVVRMGERRGRAGPEAKPIGAKANDIGPPGVPESSRFCLSTRLFGEAPAA
jgi:hypothetical protein